jgi:hypothetical protein
VTAGPLQAWYLPHALEAGLATTTQRFGPPHDAVELTLPVVEPPDLARWIDALVAARRDALAARPIRSIVRPLERVARRFLDPGDAARRAAVDAVSRVGRFGAAEVARSLDDAFGPLAGAGIGRWLAAELGSASVLDRAAPVRTGPARRAHGPEWMLQIYAGNVPSIPIWPVFAALLLKAAVLAKTSSREPLLAPLVARAIAEEDSVLGRCVAVAWWKGGAADLDRIAIGGAPAILAFGADETVASIARAAAPRARVVLHGSRVSAACVARESLSPAGARDTARRAALDIVLYDQQGCLSPHAVYVERGGRVTPAEFAALLADELAAAASTAPPARGVEEEARVRLYRTQAEFEAAVGGGAPPRVLAPGGGPGWAVIQEIGARFLPGPAHRVVRLHEVGDLSEALAALRPHARRVEAIALEARGPRRPKLIAGAASLGVPRVGALGRLQQPSPLGAHGGVGFLAPFVSWTTVDPIRVARVTAPPRATPRSPRRSGARRARGPRRR